MIIKQFQTVFTTILVLFIGVACNKNEVTQNNPNELIVTGDVRNITPYSAVFTGYANLTPEWKDAKVGIIYDINESFNEGKKIGSSTIDGNNMFTVSSEDLKPVTTYFYKSYVQDGNATKYGQVKTFTTGASKCPAGAVDLGFVMYREDKTPYILYWAECNIGATTPEEYGDYYTWGDTETYYESLDPLMWKEGKYGYFWGTYKWSNSDAKFTKYCTNTNYWAGDGSPDGKSVLDMEDDVAHLKLAGNWRMPTRSEWSRLIYKCSFSWQTNNGVNGVLVTGPNGKSIFFPVCGIWTETRCDKKGVQGYYWSSSLGNPDGAMSFAPDSKNTKNFVSLKRFLGASVRPVTE